MKKIVIAVITAVILCLLCACGEKSDTQQSSTKPTESAPTQQLPTVQEQQMPASSNTEEDTKEMFGYRYVLPVRVEAESALDGALCDMVSCDLFIYRGNVLEFSSWDEAIEQCKDELSSALFSSTRFLAQEQTATAEAPFTNKQGVEMMRVTGELSGCDGTKPYIAYYYVTDENYTRFMIVLNYEKESDAAKVIDYVAERLEKA